jgi:hypothetical protein
MITMFTYLWFVILSILVWFHKRKIFGEILMPIAAIAIFIYFLMATSGALTPFVIAVGNLDCVEDNQCIRAGYVGEVCSSIYKPVYTTYSPNLKPLSNCRCIENSCVGS